MASLGSRLYLGNSLNGLDAQKGEAARTLPWDEKSVECAAYSGAVGFVLASAVALPGMPGYRWQIKTPLGEFRLEVVQVGGRFPSAQERERVQRVWFFAQRELHSLSPAALETALELCAELGSTRDWRASGRMDPLAAQSLAEYLELALLSGRLVLKQVPRIHAWGGAHEAKASSEAQWTPRPSAQEERTSEGAWLELELRNQQGEPVANRHFRVIQHERVVREGMTNANGFARVESLSPGTCDIEFVDFDESDFNHQPALPGAAPAASSGPVTALAT